MDDLAERRKRLEARRQTLRTIRVVPPAVSSSAVLAATLSLLIGLGACLREGRFDAGYVVKAFPFLFVALAVGSIVWLSRVRATNLAKVRKELAELDARAQATEPPGPR